MNLLQIHTLQEGVLLLCFIIGAYKIAAFTLSLMRTIIYLILPGHNLIKRYGQGSWAIVTGGSDGIGSGFCEELAKQGFNICIISRTLEKMKAVEQKIKSLNNKIQTKLVQCDFTKSYTLEFYDKIMAEIQTIDIGILINNVGQSNTIKFLEIDQKVLMNEIVVNSFPIVMLSRKIIPKMLNRSKKSGIVNISSIIGTIPFPKKSQYSASKAFDDLFSRSLAPEYNDKIDILSVRPMYVKSNIIKNDGWTVIRPVQCASGSLSKLGIDRYTCGHWFHRLQFTLCHLIPKEWVYIAKEIGDRKNKL